MGIFRNFPYTNFHELNLDWIVGKVKELWEGVAAIDEKVDNFILETEPTIRDEVDNWLDEHPEATTTVTDHSITEIKLSETLADKTIKDYVTPQMYGAKADGVTDDTNAFKDAINSNKQILIPKGTYNLSENLVSDESVVFADFGTYPNSKMIISKNFAPYGMSEQVQDSVDIRQFGIKQLQGVEYNKRKNTLVLGGARITDDTIILLEIDWNTKTLIRTLDNPARLGHINDIAYDEYTNCLYIATYDIVGETNRVTVVDADLFVFRSDIYLDGVQSIGQISFDPVNRVFYITAYSGTYIYDENFNKIKTIQYGYIRDEIIENMKYPHLDTTNTPTATATQGSCVYNSQFICLCWIETARGFNSYARLSQVNYIDGSLKQQFDFERIGAYDEPEAIVTIGENIYLFGTSGNTITWSIFEMGVINHSFNQIKVPVAASDTDQFTTTYTNLIIIDKNTAAFTISVTSKVVIPQGSSYSIPLTNMSAFNGIVNGFNWKTFAMGICYGTSLTIRVFDTDLPANQPLTLYGVLSNAYFNA